ncbi:MAG: DUF4215 domain-containing protein, partial [Myxococcota bacterium]
MIKEVLSYLSILVFWATLASCQLLEEGMPSSLHPLAELSAVGAPIRNLDSSSTEKVSFCGDGIVDDFNGEQCDEGNVFTQACSYGETSCSVCNEKCEKVTGSTSFCGDGIVDGFNDEECDEGLIPSTNCSYGEASCSVCSGKCKQIAGHTSFCGDGVIDPQEEQCDDANAITESCPYGASFCTVCGDRCQITAGATSFCGDGKVDTEREQCDDGNAADFDGCNTSCNFAPETFGEVGAA